MTGPLDPQYISQYTPAVLGLAVHVAGQVADPDGQAVTAQMVNSDTGAVILNRAATRVDVGKYEITLTSNESSVPGPYTLTWHYAVNGAYDTYDIALLIGTADPHYDVLNDDMKEIVDNVWMRFADLYDSPNGGPHLQTYFQTHFGRGRIAQLMGQALRALNTKMQPAQRFTLDGVNGALFPALDWGPVLEQATYVEVIKHLRRTYVEQPMLQGGEVTRHDRRDYMDRWGQVLADEQEQLKQQTETMKIRFMGLGRPAVLVSGGVFGRFGPTRFAGSVAARPRYYARFYSVLLIAAASIAACLALSPSQPHSPSSLTSTSGLISIGQVG